jgi:glycerol-3-phosphate dehydrogenase (NAD+)
MSSPKRVCIVGSGNWGSAIARIVGANAARQPELFDGRVSMWVFEETLADGRKLSEVINATHENVKYLPGHALPPNVVAETSLRAAARAADLLIWVVPHAFLPRLLPEVCLGLADAPEGAGAAAPAAPAAPAHSISLIKGVDFDAARQRLQLISDSILAGLAAPVAAGRHSAHVEVLMGANVANEVAEGQFCEATIGYDAAAGAGGAALWSKLFDSPRFAVQPCPDRAAVELCGALKNVVALGAGFCDGLALGGNTKAAVMRIGMLEMLGFCRLFYPDTRAETLFESCGVADLITTCYGGRNRKVAAAFVEKSSSGGADAGGAGGADALWLSLERELLNGQKLQGTGTSDEARVVLQRH